MTFWRKNEIKSESLNEWWNHRKKSLWSFHKKLFSSSHIALLPLQLGWTNIKQFALYSTCYCTLIHLPQKSEHIPNLNQMVISFKEKEAAIWSLISSYVLRRTIRAKFPKDVLKSHVFNCNVAETVFFADKRMRYTNTWMHKSDYFVGTNNLSGYNWIWYCLTAEIMQEQNFRKGHSKRKTGILLFKNIRISLKNHLSVIGFSLSGLHSELFLS